MNEWEKRLALAAVELAINKFLEEEKKELEEKKKQEWWWQQDQDDEWIEGQLDD